MKSPLTFLAAILAIPFFAAVAGAEDLCARLAGRVEGLDAGGCREHRLLSSGHLSVEGTSLLFKDYAPPGREPRGRILVIGGIHGDEHSTVSLVFRWMERVERQGPGSFHWRFIPLLNPDGLLRTDSRRGNARNVDLNRNFQPKQGHGAALQYWNDRGRDPRRYPGPAPFSEPETRYVARTIASFQPDVIVALHAPYGLLDFDGPPAPPRRLGPLSLKLLGTYPGSLGNYAALQLGIPVITIELPSSRRLPPSKEVSNLWADLLKYLVRRLPAEKRTLTAWEQR